MAQVTVFKMRDEFTCSNIKDAANLVNEERNLCLCRGGKEDICCLNFNPTANNMNTKESCCLLHGINKTLPLSTEAFS